MVELEEIINRGDSQSKHRVVSDETRVDEEPPPALKVRMQITKSEKKLLRRRHTQA